MNEINFFEENKKKVKINLSGFDFKYKNFVLPIILLAVLVIFLLLSFLLNNKIKSLTEEYNSLLAKENNMVLSQQIQNNTVEVDSVFENKKYSVNAIENISNLNKVSSELVIDIKDAIPASLFLNDFSINDGVLTITGYSLSSNAVAKFQNNLLKNSNISEVFVSDITNELGNYNFTLTAKVRS